MRKHVGFSGVFGKANGARVTLVSTPAHPLTLDNKARFLDSPPLADMKGRHPRTHSQAALWPRCHSPAFHQHLQIYEEAHNWRQPAAPAVHRRLAGESERRFTRHTRTLTSAGNLKQLPAASRSVERALCELVIQQLHHWPSLSLHQGFHNRIWSAVPYSRMNKKGLNDAFCSHVGEHLRIPKIPLLIFRLGAAAQLQAKVETCEWLFPQARGQQPTWRFPYLCTPWTVSGALQLEFRGSEDERGRPDPPPKATSRAEGTAVLFKTAFQGIYFRKKVV